jgi:hypothetical protein
MDLVEYPARHELSPLPPASVTCSILVFSTDHSGAWGRTPDRGTD